LFTSYTVNKYIDEKRFVRDFSRAIQIRKQAFTYWITQVHHLEKSLSIYLNNSPHMEANFRRMMEAKSELKKKKNIKIIFCL
jgi:hypothetical protein